MVYGYFERGGGGIFSSKRTPPLPGRCPAKNPGPSRQNTGTLCEEQIPSGVSPCSCNMRTDWPPDPGIEYIRSSKRMRNNSIHRLLHYQVPGRGGYSRNNRGTNIGGPCRRYSQWRLEAALASMATHVSQRDPHAGTMCCVIGDTANPTGTLRSGGCLAQYQRTKMGMEQERRVEVGKREGLHKKMTY